VPARVSPVERIRAEIDRLFADPSRDLGDVVEDLARLASQLLGAQVTRTHALEAQVLAGFIRGLSARDVEATLAEALVDPRPPGQAVVDEADQRAEAFTARYEPTYPAALSCLTSTLDELTAHLRCPSEPWQRIRHTTCWSRPSGRAVGGPRSSDRSPANGPPAAGLGGP
jgi:hypothetical protein